MIVQTKTERVDVPGEPGEFIVVRRLMWKQLEEARLVRSLAQLRRFLALPAEERSRLQAEEAARAQQSKEESDKKDVDPLHGCDKETLLRAGIESWSYAVPLPDGVLQLDPRTAQWAAEQIVALSPEGATEADRKNG